MEAVRQPCGIWNSDGVDILQLMLCMLPEFGVLFSFMPFWLSGSSQPMKTDFPIAAFGKFSDIQSPMMLFERTIKKNSTPGLIRRKTPSQLLPS